MCWRNNGNNSTARCSGPRSETLVLVHHVAGSITHGTAFALSLCWLPRIAPTHSTGTVLPQESFAAMVTATAGSSVTQQRKDKQPHGGTGRSFAGILTNNNNIKRGVSTLAYWLANSLTGWLTDQAITIQRIDCQLACWLTYWLPSYATY
jgi:hypothetical protein